MDKKGTEYLQHFKKTKHAVKKDGFASPSVQPYFDASAIPLPPDLENEDLMSEDTTEKKSNYEQKELKKQNYGQQDKVKQVPEENTDPSHLNPVFPFVPLNEFPCLFG